MIPGISEVRPQEDTRNIQHLGDHKLDHGSGVKICSVKIKKSQMTAHDQFQITIPDTGVAKLVPFCILGQNRLIKAMGDLLNSIAQQAVARKMFEGRLYLFEGQKLSCNRKRMRKKVYYSINDRRTGC